MTKYYVNSGSTLTLNGLLIHSGDEVPANIVKEWEEKTQLAHFIDKKVIVKGVEPTLDSEKDKKKGSRLVKQISYPKTEGNRNNATAKAEAKAEASAKAEAEAEAEAKTKADADAKLKADANNNNRHNNKHNNKNR